MKPSTYIYDMIMDTVTYDPDQGHWILPSNPFKEFENDIPMFVSSKYECHSFVYNQMVKESI